MLVVESNLSSNQHCFFKITLYLLVQTLGLGNGLTNVNPLHEDQIIQYSVGCNSQSTEYPSPHSPISSMKENYGGREKSKTPHQEPAFSLAIVETWRFNMAAILKEDTLPL